jgi:hypothetical protein
LRGFVSSPKKLLFIETDDQYSDWQKMVFQGMKDVEMQFDSSRMA